MAFTAGVRLITTAIPWTALLVGAALTAAGGLMLTGRSLSTHADLAWWYPHPTAEAAQIAGYLCFYNERVDLFVDGRLWDETAT